jgi:uncharacterized membrane protein
MRTNGRAKILAVLTAFLLASLAALEAEAAIKIKLRNSASQKISVAVNFMDTKGRWMTRGWWIVEPGDIVTTDIVTNNSYIYFYAEGAEDDAVWDGSDDSDAIDRWIVDEKFSWYDNKPGRP